MSIYTDTGGYLIAATDAGMLIIHSSPITLSWIPQDTVNNAYNVGGTVTVGTFGSIDEAKQAAAEPYLVTVEQWQSTDVLPFDSNEQTQTEIHTPEIDGHTFVRHDTRWK